MNHGIRSYKKRVFENPLAFTQFLLDFQSENGFELAKDRRIEMRGSHLSTAYFGFSHWKSGENSEKARGFSKTLFL